MLVQKKRSAGLLLLLCCLLWQCVDPVEPVFRFRDGFLVVDGRLSNLPGNSFLDLSLATQEGIQYLLQPAEAQQVSTFNDRGEETIWELDTLRGLYFPPEDYAGEVGETYSLRLVAQDGRVYESKPEVMLPPVALDDFRSTFQQESYFSSELNRFVPAFELFASFTDPADSQEAYRLSYRSWEKLEVCVSCFLGQYFPPQGCTPTARGRAAQRYDYQCAEDCWELSRYGETDLITDEFSNGNSITDRKIGQIDYDWYGPILIIAELENLSADAHEFYRVLASQSNASGNLNANLPASLDGNINPAIEGEGAILGYFSISAGSEARVYFDRDDTPGTPLPFDGTIRLDIPPPPGSPYLHPCRGANRSTQRPVGWPE